VLRLLPERLYAGVFGQSSWLARGTGGEALHVPTTLPANSSPHELLAALLQANPPRHRARKLSVLLSNQYARCISLPWSADVRGEEEHRAYALAHLEQAGFGACDNYAVHAEFRHYGAQGFAYAVPRQLLDELHSVALRHELDVTTVIPLAAIAHLEARRGRETLSELSLVVEDSSVSALVMDRSGLSRYDAEPTVGGRQAALLRLLTRLAANATEFSGISLCADCDEGALAEIAGTFIGNMAVQSVKPSQWRRFL
jgi:hypothetical protein